MPNLFKLSGRLTDLRAIVLAAFVIGAAACGAGPLDPVTDPEGPAVAPPGSASDSLPAGSPDSMPVGAPDTTPPDSVPSAAPPAPLPAPSTQQGIPFGFFMGDYYQLGPTLTATLRGASVGAVVKYLQVARERGARVFIQFAGGRDKYLDSEGNFSLAKWRDRVAPYKSVDLSSYIADGTLAAHYLIDEPEDPSRWNGKPVDYRELEEAAKYSKEVFPGLTTIVRVVPTWLQGAPFRWVSLDAAWAQYTASKGDVTLYRDTQIAAARDQGLGLMFSLNVLDGGDGSSGRPGTSSGRHNMSALELATYGKALIEAPYACGLMMWREDADYVAAPEIRSAMEVLSAQAKARPASSCNQA
jgi:hypothetical protein